jgi:branched-subunit amino acid transport protein AzlD
MFDSQIVSSIFIMTAVILLTRILPFLLLNNRKIPDILNYLERNIPPLIMLLLVFYCLKDVKWTSAPYGTLEFGAIAVVTTIHIWKRNALLSIVSGTGAYMLMIKTWVST